jgi:hypothetical protein
MLLSAQDSNLGTRLASACVNMGTALFGALAAGTVVGGRWGRAARMMRRAWPPGSRPRAAQAAAGVRAPSSCQCLVPPLPLLARW